MPARNASRNRGARIAAPLPTAAAKASVDMAMPSRKMEKGCIGNRGGRDGIDMRLRPALRRHADGLANPDWCRAPRPLQMPSVLTRTLPAACDAGSWLLPKGAEVYQSASPD
jgi:hypothetical protein